MENISKGFNKIAEIGISLGAVSFAFYFMGVIYKYSYFSALGVSKVFLDFSYQEYVFSGVLNLFPLLPFAPMFLDWYSDYVIIEKNDKKIEKSYTEVKEIELRQKATGDNIFAEMIKETKAKIEELQKQIKEIKLRFSTRDPFEILNRKRYTIVFFVIFIIVAIFLYSKNKISIASLIVQLVLGVIISFVAFNQIKQRIEGKRISSFQKLWVLIMISTMLLPLFCGYTDGWARLKENDFSKFKVITQNEIITDIGLITFSKGVYVFRSGYTNIFIPEREIIRMEISD